VPLANAVAAHFRIYAPLSSVAKICINPAFSLLPWA
jgi:hypothetical protein